MKKYIRESLKSTKKLAEEMKQAARTTNTIVEDINLFLKNPKLSYQETGVVLQILDRVVLRRTNLASLATRQEARRTVIESFIASDDASTLRTVLNAWPPFVPQT